MEVDTMSDLARALKVFYPKYLAIESIHTTPRMMHVEMVSHTKSAVCPACGRRSRRVHSTHVRNAQDLSLLDHGVELSIESNRYFCTNKGCSEKVFMERYDRFLERYARFTNRCKDFITRLAVATDAETASKILRSIHIKASGDTLLRYTRKQGEAVELPPTKGIGVDDWAYQKRHTYGTIIVDLETHQPLELLEGRDGKTFKEWLRQHPDIKIVARDRSSAYASAVEEVLPNAIQIADRFHISKNLLDALKLSLSAYMPSNIRFEELEAQLSEPAEEAVDLKKNGSRPGTSRQTRDEARHRSGATAPT